jgi:3-hydroxyacyl-[acyl-carrier-protein] dehydratase
MRLEYFQLVDRVLELDFTGCSIRALAQVPLHGPVFEGHFPGYPLMPGVLLIEAMAQTAGWLLLALNDLERMPVLAAVKQAKLRQFVKPGERLALSASLTHDGSGYAVTEGAIEVADKAVCNAEITLRLLPFPNKHLQRVMRQRAAEIELPMRAAAHG